MNQSPFVVGLGRLGAVASCVLALSLNFACSRSRRPDPDPGPKPAAKDHADEPGHEGAPRQVHLSAEVVRDAKIQWAPVGKESLASTLTLPGDLSADPDKSGRISSPVAGRIEGVSFKEGSLVNRGDSLAVVRVPDLGRIRGAHLAATSKAKAARMNADRSKLLLDQHLTTTQTFLDAQAEADALDAEARALGEQLRAMGAAAGGAAGSDYLLTIRSPVTGTVVHRDAVVGQPVGADQTLGAITDLGEVWFVGRVFEKDLGRLRVGAKAEVELNAFPRERFQGIVSYLGQQIDPVARTVTARIVIPNRDGLLRLGLFGNARVATGEDDGGPPTLVIPRSALTEISGKPTVFVRHQDGDFERHPVEVGASALGRVEITSGLREGEEVVTAGVFTLKSAVLKAAFAGEE